MLGNALLNGVCKQALLKSRNFAGLYTRLMSTASSSSPPEQQVDKNHAPAPSSGSATASGKSKQSAATASTASKKISLDMDPTLAAIDTSGLTVEQKQQVELRTAVTPQGPLTPSEVKSRSRLMKTLATMSAIMGAALLYAYYDRKSVETVDPMAPITDAPPELAHLKEHEQRSRIRAQKARERRHVRDQGELHDAAVVSNDDVANAQNVSMIDTTSAKKADSDAIPAQSSVPLVSEEQYISAQNAAASAGTAVLTSARESLSSLSSSVITNISDYEAKRQAYLNKLRYALENGTGGSERLVALLESHDEDFFKNTRELLDNYTKTALNVTEAAVTTAQAQQAAAFAKSLRSEADAVRAAVKTQYDTALATHLDSLRSEVSTETDAQLYRLALEHTQAMDTLTNHYSTLLDELSAKVTQLSHAMDLHNRRRYQSEALQRLSVALVDAERRVDRGETLIAPWTDLELISHMDPVLKAALATVPPHIVSNGAAPVMHLQRRFEAVSEAARGAAYLPPEPSLIAHVLSRVFGKATLEERALVAVPTVNSDFSLDKVDDAFFKSIEYDHARISRASFFLRRGQVAEVVRELDAIRNPHTKAACHGFIGQARERLVVEQALSLVRAHANGLYKDMFN